MREITFTMDDKRGAVHCYGAALALIEEGRSFTTTQVMLLDHPVTRRAYDVIRLVRDGEEVVIKVVKEGDDVRYECDAAPFELRRVHSIASLWLAGVL